MGSVFSSSKPPPVVTKPTPPPVDPVKKERMEEGVPDDQRGVARATILSGGISPEDSEMQTGRARKRILGR